MTIAALLWYLYDPDEINSPAGFLRNLPLRAQVTGPPSEIWLNRGRAFSVDPRDQPSEWPEAEDTLIPHHPFFAGADHTISARITTSEEKTFCVGKCEFRRWIIVKK